MEQLKFEELPLSQNVKKALKEIGYEYATPIQEQAIPYVLEGKDVIGQSQTGTGKTASYALPMLEKIDKEQKAVQAIILCPTRELATQVADEIRKYTKYEENMKCLAIYGGEPIERQIQALKRGVKIVIGTPGRIMDHMRRKTLKLDQIKMVVLDEADEMLNIGFEEDINTILQEVPEQRQTVLFSATMNERIMRITRKYLNKPKKVKIEAKELTVGRIEQIVWELKNPMKDDAVMRLLDTDHPKKVVIFCNTKRKVDNLLEILKKNGYKAEALHGDVKQAQRERIMKRFKSGEFQCLVATDVVARGIDVEDLELVINYDIPQEDEYYVHRIGRTGRNGNEGKAYTFVVGKERNKLLQIQKYANTKIKKGNIPTIQEVEKIKLNHLAEKLSKQMQEEVTDEETNQKVEKILAELLKESSYEKIAKAFLCQAIQKQEKAKKIKLEFNPEQAGASTKLFFNLGKKDNIMVKDIVGSVSSNCAISGSEIGKINIMDKFSFVEVPTVYVEEVLNGMKGKPIKGHNVNIEVANA